MNTFTHATALRIFIKRPANEVYEYAFDMGNFPEWVGFCQSIHLENGEWIMETTQNPMKVRITERNDLGVIDHFVSPFSRGGVWR